MDELRARAQRLVREPVRIADLALRFEETTASSAEVHVGGDEFFPPLLEDIAAATSSVHVNQFGFRPGEIGERFATALLAKAAEGIPVRLVVDWSGSYRGSAGREFYDRLRAGGIEVGVVRAVNPRVPSQLGHFDHRKFFVLDGRTAWIGGAGIEDHFADGRFHDMFMRLTGPVASQLQLVFLASFRWLGGSVPEEQLDMLFPELEEGSIPATTLHNAPGRYRPITDTIARLLEEAHETLDVVNPYITDRRMIQRIGDAARRGVSVRLFVPAKANNKACASAQLFHHGELLDAGVHILGHPAMLHAKAFVRDREEVLIGTCNLDGWSLKRFFEIDVLVRSEDLATQFDERFSVPAEAASAGGRVATGMVEKIQTRVFHALAPLL